MSLKLRQENSLLKMALVDTLPLSLSLDPFFESFCSKASVDAVVSVEVRDEVLYSGSLSFSVCMVP